MMKDNHVAGEGNAYYTLFREYDPDLGRWWRPDPIFQPWQSPYSAFNGNPIMFTDVWGLEAEEKKAPPKGSEQNPYRLPEVTKIDDAPEGTRKIEYVSGYSMPIYLAKHDGKWISATEYGGKMENLVNNLNNKDYDPSSDGFNLDEPLSDSFFSEFATRASRQWGNQSHLLNKIFEKGGYRNPFFSGHGLEDNSQEIVGYVGGGLSIARGLFKKAFGWLAGKSASTLSVEAVEAASKDLVKGGGIIFGKNSKGHLIKHANVLGLDNYSPQELQKMIPQLEDALNSLFSRMQLAKIGQWHGFQNAKFYIGEGKMIVTESNGTFITTINKTSNKWFNEAKAIK